MNVVAWNLEGLFKLSGSSIFQVRDSEDLVAGRPYSKVRFSTRFLQFNIFTVVFDILIPHQVHRQLLNFLSSHLSFGSISNL